IIEKSMKTEMIKYLVAEDNGKIIGSCYLVIIPNITNNCRSIGFIENVITDENYRGKGIGKNIIRKAIELSKNENCYKVILQSGMKRERAHTFYEKLGFDGESKKAFDLRLEEN
ncbi:MAG: GNAT family N-acetyltransferase, partial [Spirochaetes bacterium GWE2_31_10]